MSKQGQSCWGNFRGRTTFRLCCWRILLLAHWYGFNLRKQKAKLSPYFYQITAYFLFTTNVTALEFFVITPQLIFDYPH